MRTNKRCSRCGVEQELKNFFRDWSRRDGYAHRCKRCAQAYCKDHWKMKFSTDHTFREKYLARNRVWATTNKEKFSASKKRYKKRGLEQCSDVYLRERLSRGTALSAKQIPIELVEVKRMQVVIERTLKEVKDEKRC